MTDRIETLKAEVAGIVQQASGAPALERRLDAIEVALATLGEARAVESGGNMELKAAAEDIRAALAAFQTPDLSPIEDRLKSIEARFDAPRRSCPWRPARTSRP